MQESGGVEQNLHPRFHHVVEVGVRRQVHDLRIGPRREHQPHVDAGQRRHLQGRVQHVRRQVVGGLYPYPPPGVRDRVAVGLEQRPPLAEGAAGDDLENVIREPFRLGKIRRTRYVLFGGRRPVAQERHLKPCRAAALDPEMSVAPRTPFRAADVAVGDVHAADESHAAVDDGDFTVVTVVDLAGEERELDVQEREDLDSLAAHPFEKVFFHAAAPHVVVEYAHLDPLPGLFHQRIAQAAARFIVAEDVILNVNMMLRPGDFGQQGLHFRGAVGVGDDVAAVERYGVDRAVKKRGQLAVLLRDFGPLRVVGLLELHGDAPARAARNDAPFGEVLSEKEIEQQPHDGCEHEYDDPRQGLQRVPVVGDDDQDDAEDRDRIENEERICQYLLHIAGFFVSCGALRRAGRSRITPPPAWGSAPSRAGARRPACSCVCGVCSGRERKRNNRV